MIIDTDVVTSTSVKVKYDHNINNRKRGRETRTDLPEQLLGNSVLPDHVLPEHELRKKMGEIQQNIKNLMKKNKIKNNEKSDGEKGIFTVTPMPVLADSLQTKSKFKRYHIPPEVRVSSNIAVPKYRSMPEEQERNGKVFG